MCLRKLFCRHEYHLLTRYKMDTDPTIGYRSEEVCIIYCPKCKHEDTVTKHRYESIIAKQKIDKEYRDERDRYKYDK